MIIPKDIVTKHKIRDSKICSLWSRDAWSMDEIGVRFHMSSTRVHQIISKNRHLIKIDKEYEKTKRINVLKRLLKKHPENIGNKTTIDVIDQLRNETEGRDGEGSGNRETKVIIIRELAHADKDTSGDVPRSLSVLRV